MKSFSPSAVLVGLAAGLLSGLMGVGGGIVAVPAMTALMGVSQHQAHGTSLAMIAITATASALAYASRGYVDLSLTVVLSVGTVIGAYLGARLMPLVPARRLRQVFAVFVLAVGIRMVVG